MIRNTWYEGAYGPVTKIELEAEIEATQAAVRGLKQRLTSREGRWFWAREGRSWRLWGRSTTDRLRDEYVRAQRRLERLEAEYERGDYYDQEADARDQLEKAEFRGDTLRVERIRREMWAHGFEVEGNDDDDDDEAYRRKRRLLGL